MKKILLIGEPMAMFVADSLGPLEEVEHFTKMLAGAEVNVCIGLSRLGFCASYLTRLGKEPMGYSIYNRLKKEGIDTSNIQFDDFYTTAFQLKSKVEEGDPVVVYYRKGSAASHIQVKDIEKVDFSSIDYLHLTGIPPALSPDCRAASFALLKKAKEHNIFTSFDPNLRPSLWEDEETMIRIINELAVQCDMVLPGIEEGKILSGKDSAEEIAEFYLEAGIKTVVIKNGSKGACFANREGIEFVPGYTVEKVIDTVGAGDGFAVGVITGLLDGLPMRDAVQRGNAIGAIQVTCKGDNEGLPNREALAQFMQRQEGKR